MHLFINIETTGLDPKIDRIVELAILKIDPVKFNKELFHRYFNPEILITREVKRIINLDNDLLQKSPKFATEANEFIKFIKGDPLVSHNIKFVAEFINMELKRAKCESLKNNLIDTLDYARKLNPEDENTIEFLYKKYEFDKMQNNSVFKELMIMPDLFKLLKNKSTN